MLLELLSSFSFRYVSMIKSCHSLISFFTFSTCVPFPVLLKSSGFIRISRAQELMLWSLRSINWLNAVTERG